MDLPTLVADFAQGIELADIDAPQAVSKTGMRSYQRGIGPHSEGSTVAMVMKALQSVYPEAYTNRYELGVAYPETSQLCDLCFGDGRVWELAVEVKMARFLGDNGKQDPNMITHLLSPYPKHHSALTDIEKLRRTRLAPMRALLIYGYEHDDWPLDLAISAIERLANGLGPRHEASFFGLKHPVFQHGAVYAWHIT